MWLCWISTARIRRGSDSNNRQMNARLVFCQAPSSSRFMSSTQPIRWLLFLTCLFSTSHKFSITFKSGDCPGHLRTGMLLSLLYCPVSRDLWTVALSFCSTHRFAPKICKQMATNACQAPRCVVESSYFPPETPKSLCRSKSVCHLSPLTILLRFP